MPAVLTPEQRESLIVEYEKGAVVLRTAWEGVPKDAEKWPAPDKWSAHAKQIARNVAAYEAAAPRK